MGYLFAYDSSSEACRVLRVGPTNATLWDPGYDDTCHHPT